MQTEGRGKNRKLIFSRVNQSTEEQQTTTTQIITTAQPASSPNITPSKDLTLPRRARIARQRWGLCSPHPGRETSRQVATGRELKSSTQSATKTAVLEERVNGKDGGGLGTETLSLALARVWGNMTGELPEESSPEEVRAKLLDLISTPEWKAAFLALPEPEKRALLIAITSDLKRRNEIMYPKTETKEKTRLERLQDRLKIFQHSSLEYHLENNPEMRASFERQLQEEPEPTIGVVPLFPKSISHLLSILEPEERIHEQLISNNWRASQAGQDRITAALRNTFIIKDICRRTGESFDFGKSLNASLDEKSLKCSLTNLQQERTRWRQHQEAIEERVSQQIAARTRKYEELCDHIPNRDGTGEVPLCCG